MFREKWDKVLKRIQGQQQRHFQEPAGADYCGGQRLQHDKTLEYLSYHCYDPTCPERRRHHRLLAADLKRKKNGPWTGPNFEVQLDLSMSSREQIVVAELCEAFGEPLLQPLDQPWHDCDKPTFDELFDDTAACLAMFLREEVGLLEQVRPPAAATAHRPEHAEQLMDSWQRLEPQIKDVLKVLWQGDLTSEGIYLNIATYIRKLSSRLLMHAMGKWVDSPSEYVRAGSLRSPIQKAHFLLRKDRSLEPFTDACLVVDKLATALIHNKDAADFKLASNTGNTTIIICRGIVMACAKYMDWFGWSDLSHVKDPQVSFKKYLGRLKHEIAKSTNEIERCLLCYEKPLTHGFMHGQTVFWCACEECALHNMAKTGKCPLTRTCVEQVVKVFKHGWPGEEEIEEEEEEDVSGNSRPGPAGSHVPAPSAAAVAAHPGASQASGSVSEAAGMEAKRRRMGLSVQGAEGPRALQQQCGLQAGEASEPDPKVAAQKQLAALSLEDAQAQPQGHGQQVHGKLTGWAAQAEAEAAWLWDDGLQEQALAVLRRALSQLVGPSSDAPKVRLLLRLLEYSVQRLGATSSPAQQAACQAIVTELAGLMHQTLDSSKSASSSASASDAGPPAPALRRRFLFWCGRLQGLLGRPREAAASFHAAAHAAQQGGGDVRACLAEAAAEHCAATEAAHAEGQLGGALEAALAGVHAADACGSKAHIVRAAALGADLYASGAGGAALPASGLLQALQLYVVALKQMYGKLPAGVRASSAERMACRCAEVLEQVRPLCKLKEDAHGHVQPPEFVQEVERVLRDTASVIKTTKIQEEMQTLGFGLEQLGQATRSLKRSLDVQDRQRAHSTPAGHTGGAVHGSDGSGRVAAPPTPPMAQQQQQQQQGQQSTVAAHLFKHRHTLMAHWRRFDENGCHTPPVPVGETEEGRKLREAITADVIRYFEASSKQLKMQQGQPIPEGPLTLSPKMRAFAHSIAMQMYLGAKAADPLPPTAASPPQPSSAATPPAPPVALVQHHSAHSPSSAQVQTSEMAAAQQPQQQLQKGAGSAPGVQPPLPACAHVPNPHPRSSVAEHLTRQQHVLTALWRNFDGAGFEGMPIPADESEDNRKLREAITADVYSYFAATHKQHAIQRGQELPGNAPPAFSPKMHAFIQTVAFKMYLGARISEKCTD